MEGWQAAACCAAAQHAAARSHQKPRRIATDGRQSASKANKPKKRKEG